MDGLPNHTCARTPARGAPGRGCPTFQEVRTAHCDTDDGTAGQRRLRPWPTPVRPPAAVQLVAQDSITRPSLLTPNERSEQATTTDSSNRSAYCAPVSPSPRMIPKIRKPRSRRCEVNATRSCARPPDRFRRRLDERAGAHDSMHSKTCCHIACVRSFSSADFCSGCSASRACSSCFVIRSSAADSSSLLAATSTCPARTRSP